MEALEAREHVDNWNDDRLDEFARVTRQDFVRVEGQMKEGFAKVDERFDKVDERLEKVDERFEKVEGQMKEGFEKADQRLEKTIQSVCEQMKEGFAGVERQFAKVEGQIKEGEDRSAVRMDRLEDRQEKLQYWIWGIGATLVIGVIVHFV